VLLSSVVRAARRPQSYLAQGREAASLAVTAAMWPFGRIDRGIAELRSRAHADTSRVRTPVLLIHGYGANKSNWYFVDRELRGAGFERIHALNYSPLSGGIPDLAERATLRARELMEHFGTDRIHIVGHSLGGIVARYAIQLGGLEGVDTCVTVASPHRGTPMARFGVGITARQLRPGSEVLRRLSASSRRLPTRFVAFYSNVDVLSPGWCSRIDEPVLRATNVLVKDEGHLSLMLSRRLAVALAAQLGAAEGVAGYGASVAELHPQDDRCEAAPEAGTRAKRPAG
jgi:pimeloyl-ACP methyl ester carboxylesterase